MPCPVAGCREEDFRDKEYDNLRMPRVCWLYWNRDDYRAMWDGNPVGLMLRTRLPLQTCTHRGIETGTTRCQTCAGQVLVKLFSCDVHGLCTVGKSIADYACCAACKDYAAPPFVSDQTAVRHLLYHIYPVKWNGMWQWNVAQLRERIGMFNGRRLIAIAEDGRTDCWQDVERAMDGMNVQTLRISNDPDLREVASFLPLFEYMRSVPSKDFILYAHSKGVSRPLESTSRRWAEKMYQVHMDYWPLVEEYLKYFPVVGAFKKHGAGWKTNESASQWHFSGAWAWYRAGDLFGQSDWRTIDQFWSGIEPYPSLHFPTQKAASLFMEAGVQAMNLYDHNYWNQTVDVEWQKWATENASKRKAWNG